MKRISVLGSTGSIGRQSLDVINNNPDVFEVYSLCADSNSALLCKQANYFKPKYIGIRSSDNVDALKAGLSYPANVITGDKAATVLASLPDVEIVINAVSGIAGFLPLVAAIKAEKTIAAANKESIICAHSILDGLKTDKNQPLVVPFSNGAQIIPVDSEQSAIFQCLQKETRRNIDTLVLTASGGAFRDYSLAQMKTVKPSDALKHPTWNMGKKITIDSATLFNKGLEIMEASYLFGVPGERIEVVIQKQSIIHSMVRFCDGTLKAQMSVPDMRGAIQYALTYPRRIKSQLKPLDFGGLQIDFQKPDYDRFPALELAYDALKEGDILPVVYNGANEEAVKIFFEKEYGFLDIAKRVEYALNKMRTFGTHSSSIENIIEIDNAARRYAREWKENM